MAFNALNRNKDRPDRLIDPEEARFLCGPRHPENERSVHCRTMPLNALQENRRIPSSDASRRATVVHRNVLAGRPEKDRNPYERPKSRRVEAELDDETTVIHRNLLIGCSDEDRNPYERPKSRNVEPALDDEKRIRREIANSNERRRMQGINEGIEMLQRLLPVKGNEKLSKAAVLHNAAELVHKLEQETKVLGELNIRMRKGMVNSLDRLNHRGEPLLKRRPRLWELSDSGEDACDSKQEILHLRRQIALEKSKRMELEKKINNLESCFYGGDSYNSGQDLQGSKKTEDFSNSSPPATELDSPPVAHSPIYNGVIRHGSSSSTVPVSLSTTTEISSTTSGISSTNAEISSTTTESSLTAPGISSTNAEISSTTTESSSTAPEISSTGAEGSSSTPESSSPSSVPESSFRSSLENSDPSSECSAPLSKTDAALILETLKNGDNSTRNNVTLQANYGVGRNSKPSLKTIVEAVKVVECPNVFYHILQLDHHLVSSKSSLFESVNVIQCVKKRGDIFCFRQKSLLMSYFFKGRGEFTSGPDLEVWRPRGNEGVEAPSYLPNKNSK